MLGNPRASVIIVRSLRLKLFPTKSILCMLPHFSQAQGAWSNWFIMSHPLLDPTVFSFHKDDKEPTARMVKPMGDLPEIPDIYEFVELFGRGIATVVNISEERVSLLFIHVTEWSC